MLRLRIRKDTSPADNAGRFLGDRLLRLPICGGSWNNTSNAGVFNVNLNNPRSNSNSNIGFRSALLSYARGWMIYESPDSARG